MSFHLAVYVRAIITLSHIQEVDVIETGRVQLCLGKVLSLIIGAATFICQQNHLINEISLALFELYHVGVCQSWLSVLFKCTRIRSRNI